MADSVDGLASLEGEVNAGGDKRSVAGTSPESAKAAASEADDEEDEG